MELSFALLLLFIERSYSSLIASEDSFVDPRTGLVYQGTPNSPVKSIEKMVAEQEHDKNSMIATSEQDDVELYEDFYDELDNWVQPQDSMNIIYFGPPASFMRIDTESILHLLTYTRTHLIPISRVLLAWDIITDGKTAAHLTGREYLALGPLLNVVPEEDLYYVNFGDPSVLSFFARHSVNLYSRKFGILVASYRRYFGNIWHSNASRINDLGFLLCGFPSVDLGKIRPEVFKSINVDVFDKLGRCSPEQAETLYKIATDDDAYGKPYKWSSHEISRLSTLFTYIPENEISAIQLEAITAITPIVMKKMNQNKLQYFTKQQILRMNPKTSRIFVLRMQLKGSYDMNQLSKKNARILQPQFPIYSMVIVTLFFYSEVGQSAFIFII